MPKLTIRNVVGLKSETTQGTPVVPSTAVDYILAMDADVKVMTEKIERDYRRSNIDPVPHAVGKRWAEVTFKTEIKTGGGATGATSYKPFDTALRACGYVTASMTSPYVHIQYLPSSSADSVNYAGPGTSCTMEIYKDGLKHIVYGSLGTAKLTFEAGKIPMAEFTFKGLYTAVTDATMPTVTYGGSSVPPIVQSSQLKLDAYSPVSAKVEIDLGVGVEPRDDVNSANGLLGFVITKREPKGTIEIETPTVAAKDVFGALIAGTEGALVLRTAPDANSVQWEVSGASVQYNDVAYGDKGGIMTHSIPIRFNGNGSSYNNSIIFRHTSNGLPV
jgi:hypothetical protein